MGWMQPAALAAVGLDGPIQLGDVSGNPIWTPPLSRRVVGVLPQHLTFSCIWLLVSFTICSSMAFLISCCSSIFFSSLFVSCSTDLASKMGAGAGLASPGLLGQCPLPPKPGCFQFAQASLQPYRV